MYCVSVKLNYTYHPLGSTNANTDVNAFAPGADFSYLGMDPNDLPDSELDPSDAASSSSEDDSNSDPDDQSEVHPCLKPLEDKDADISGHSSLSIGDPDNIDLDDNSDTVYAEANPPDFVRRLQKQLLAGYTLPNHPSVNDPGGYTLSESERLSLEHYIAWVDSRGTVKAYQLHAEVLQNATNIEILTLYMVRKLATKLLGLSSQLVDMCPKSCMAYTGEFKDLQFCTHTRDRRNRPCGEPRFDKKGLPRAQMIYNPIAPIIQSFYRNKGMAEAMRYRHQSLQDALKKLKDNGPPTEYSDFSDSISHINHSHLFEEETDTAITISGDGAQLTMKKQSDVWVLIVTILNLPPNMRSKANNIIIPLVIPGPSSPGNVESFVYVLYEELAKLSVGVWAWDALTETYFCLRVYLCGVLGDMLGSAKLSKMAGHMALYGCRFCTVRGARPSRKPGMT